MIGLNKVKQVLNKSGHKCSLCGKTTDLTYRKFIPDYVPLSYSDYENLIPVCNECDSKHHNKFIELGNLKYLPSIYIQQCLRYYFKLDKYIHKYVIMFSKNKIGIEEVQRTLLIINSYNQFIKDNKELLDWEEFR